MIRPTHLSRHSILTFVLGSFLALCVANVSALAGVAETKDQAVWQEVSPCPFPAAAHLNAERITCGYLKRPVTNANPDAASATPPQMVRIPVAVIHARDKTAKLDPVVFVAGGPGAAPIESKATFDLFASHMFNKDRDIIIYTQRGGLGTTPELACEALDVARSSIYLKDQTLNERDNEIASLARSCLNQLSNKDVYLPAFSAVENAADLVAIRRALDIPRWNIMAVSYGTLISLHAARLDPAGTRSLVLDSVTAPESELFTSDIARNFADAITAVIEACAAETSCDAAYPHLQDSLYSAIKNLRSEPWDVTLTSPDGKEASMIVNWHDLLGLLHWMLYNKTTLTWVPALIDDVAAGERETLTLLLEQVFPAPFRNNDASSGLFFAMVCNDQDRAQPSSATVDQRYGGFSITSYMNAACADMWASNQHKITRSTPPLSLPVLLLSGEFDPITPARYASATAMALSRATHIRVTNFGHSTLSGYTACQTELAQSFLNSPEEDLDTQCLSKLGPPKFAADVALIRKLLSR